MNNISKQKVRIDYIDGYQLEVNLIGELEFNSLLNSGYLKLDTTLSKRFLTEVYTMDGMLVIKSKNYGRIAEAFKSLDDLLLFKRSAVIAISRQTSDIYSYVYYLELEKISFYLNSNFKLVENHFKDSLIKLYKNIIKDSYLVVYLNSNNKFLTAKYFSDFVTLNAIQPQNI